MARGRQSTKIERSNIKGISALSEKYKIGDVEVMPSGIFYLDLLLGGGIPRGRFIELASPSGLGKSTLALNVAKNLCEQGYIVHWWDYEHALTNGLIEGVGIEEFVGSKFLHLEPMTYGDAEEILDGMAQTEYPDLIIIDSETAMLPDKMVNDSILSMEPGVKSRLSSNFLLKYKGWAKKNQVSILFINQMRTKISFIANQTTDDSAGGNALKFYCDYRIRGRRTADMVREEMTPEGKKKVIFGVEAALWAVKNRNVRSHVELTFPIVFGRGVSNIQILRNILVNNGLATSAGSYFKVTIEGVYEGTVQGNKGLNQVIRENKDAIENMIKEKGFLDLVKEIEG